MENPNKRYNVIVKPSAQKALERLPDKDYARVAARIALLGLEPLSGKKLHGEYEGFLTLRVWPYRIVYYIQNEELLVVVITIAHRKDAYK